MHPSEPTPERAQASTPSGAQASTPSRRAFIGRTAAGVAAGGLVWATPSILTLDAAAAASCGTGGSINWQGQTTGSSPASITSNGVVATITTVTNGFAQADAFTVVQPPGGGFGGQTNKYYRLSMLNASNQAELDVTFAFTKASVPITVNSLKFTLFDIDGATNLNWWDKIIIETVPAGAAFTATKPGTTNPPTGAGTAASPLLGGGTVTDTTNNGNAVIAFSTPVSSVKVRYIENKTTANNDNQYVGIGNLTWTGCT